MINEKVNNKVIKDLEAMAKKLKKRIILLEKTGILSEIDYSNQIAILAREYRAIEREIVEISNMTYTSNSRPI